MIYTVVCSYFATGEGFTLSVWIGFARDPKSAVEKFSKAVPNGSYWAQGAECFEGVNTSHVVCRNLLTPIVIAQMQDETCMREFHSQLHYNYS